MVKKKILVVEDNEDMLILYKRLFRREHDMEISFADTAEAALQIMETSPPDLMLIDISLPGISGLELSRKVHESMPAVKILIVSGHEISRYREEAMNSGALEVMSKDFSVEIVNKCRELLRN